MSVVVSVLHFHGESSVGLLLCSGSSQHSAGVSCGAEHIMLVAPCFVPARLIQRRRCVRRMIPMQDYSGGQHALIAKRPRAGPPAARSVVGPADAPGLNQAAAAAAAPVTANGAVAPQVLTLWACDAVLE